MVRLIFSISVALSLSTNIHAQTFDVVTETYEPFVFEKGGSVEGIIADHVRDIFGKANLPINLKIYPWKRSQLLTQKNRNTFIFPLVKTESRRALYIWVGKIGQIDTYIYHLSDNEDLKNEADLLRPWLRMGVIHGAADYEYAKKKGISFDSANDLKQLITMLTARRTDFIALPQRTFRYLLNKLSLQKSQFKESIFLPELSAEVYLAANRNSNAEPIELLKQAMEDIFEDESH